MIARRLALVLAPALLGGCPSDDEGPPADFPADYESSYVEVRNCRASGDHDLNQIRILADPAALAPYQNRTDPFPVGAIVLKEEYEFGDATCSGPIKQWTVMRKLEPGSADDTLGWAWQRVDADRKVVEEDPPRCIGCHQACGVPPDGYDWTCALP